MKCTVVCLVHAGKQSFVFASSNGKIGIVGNCGIHLVEEVEMKTKPRNNLSALKPPFRESLTADLFNLQAFFASHRERVMIYRHSCSLVCLARREIIRGIFDAGKNMLLSK